MVNTVETAERFLTLKLSGDLYAISIDDIEEVVPALPLEPVPQAPSFVRGVVFIRGELIPVIDAAERLGLKNHLRPVENRIVCMRWNERLIGIEFDDAIDVVDLSAATRLEASQIDCRAGFLTSLMELEGSVFRVLSPQKLLTLAESDDLESAI